MKPENRLVYSGSFLGGQRAPWRDSSCSCPSFKHSSSTSLSELHHSRAALLMAAYEPQTLKIESVERGVFLDVWLYTPSTSGPYPLVVAGHGYLLSDVVCMWSLLSTRNRLSVIKAAGLQAFGQRWATDAGYASLIFDYRCFGDSDGQPRNLVSLDKQLQDYRSVINWARQRPDIFMNNKIVAMGSALSGLSVASLIIEDSALAGAMAHSPMLEGNA